MIDSLVSSGVGLLTLVSILVLWVAVQTTWRRLFSDYCTDPDALADRRGCVGCRAKKKCHRRAVSPDELEGIS